MLISGNNNLSQLKTCLETAHNFRLSEDEAMNIFENQKQSIENNWDTTCDEAELINVDKNLLWNQQFLNSSAFEGL